MEVKKLQSVFAQLIKKIKLPKYLWFKIISFAGQKYCYGFEMVKNTEINKILFNACKYGNLGLVKLMIEKGTDDFKLGLGAACYGGQLEIAKYLIKYGAYNFNYGLYCACSGKQLEMIQYIIKKGANDFNGGLKCTSNAEIINLLKSYM